MVFDDGENIQPQNFWQKIPSLTWITQRKVDPEPYLEYIYITQGPEYQKYGNAARDENVFRM